MLWVLSENYYFDSFIERLIEEVPVRRFRESKHLCGELAGLVGVPQNVLLPPDSVKPQSLASLSENEKLEIYIGCLGSNQISKVILGTSQLQEVCEPIHFSSWLRGRSSFLAGDHEQPRQVARYNEYELDFEQMLLRATNDEVSVPLSVKELTLLKCFFEHRGSCISRNQLLEEVWKGTKVAPRTIDSQISRLRQRLQHILSIESVYRSGYVLR